MYSTLPPVACDITCCVHHTSMQDETCSFFSASAGLDGVYMHNPTAARAPAMYCFSLTTCTLTSGSDAHPLLHCKHCQHTKPSDSLQHATQADTLCFPIVNSQCQLQLHCSDATATLFLMASASNTTGWRGGTLLPTGTCCSCRLLQNITTHLGLCG